MSWERGVVLGRGPNISGNGRCPGQGFSVPSSASEGHYGATDITGWIDKQKEKLRVTHDLIFGGGATV